MWNSLKGMLSAPGETLNHPVFFVEEKTDA